MTSNKLIPVLLALAVLGIAFFVGYCSREPEPVKPETTAETVRKNTVAVDSIESAKYKELAAKQAAEIAALKRELSANKPKDKQATEQARQSALKYANSGKAEDCRIALTDCQAENETKGYSLAVQERMLLICDSIHITDKAEIDRQVSVIDTLATGWQKANLENGKLEKKIKRKNTLLKIGAGIIAVLGVLVAAR